MVFAVEVVDAALGQGDAEVGAEAHQHGQVEEGDRAVGTVAEVLLHVGGVPLSEGRADHASCEQAHSSKTNM